MFRLRAGLRQDVGKSTETRKNVLIDEKEPAKTWGFTYSWIYWGNISHHRVHLVAVWLVEYFEFEKLVDCRELSRKTWAQNWNTSMKTALAKLRQAELRSELSLELNFQKPLKAVLVSLEKLSLVVDDKVEEVGMMMNKPGKLNHSNPNFYLKIVAHNQLKYLFESWVSWWQFSLITNDEMRRKFMRLFNTERISRVMISIRELKIGNAYHWALCLIHEWLNHEQRADLGLFIVLSANHRKYWNVINQKASCLLDNIFYWIRWWYIKFSIILLMIQKLWSVKWDYD